MPSNVSTIVSHTSAGSACSRMAYPWSRICSTHPRTSGSILFRSIAPPRVLRARSQSRRTSSLSARRPPARAPYASSAMPAALVSPDDVEEAARRIAPYVRRTPVLDHAGACLKLELLQHAGSFKTRGAFNRLLTEALPASGVLAASGGNHGAALAYAASRLEVRAEVLIPSTSPMIKRRLIERLGATVTVVEGYYDHAQRAADERQHETGALMVHPFDHPATVAGQGTMGRELEEQLGSLDTLLVASGGGGFTAGQGGGVPGRGEIGSGGAGGGARLPGGARGRPPP